MSNVTGNGGSFSSEAQQQEQEQARNFHGSNSLLSTHSNGSTAPPPAKKKRNLPGTPDPKAEVIALSPKTLLATNRFVCEICNKGFQRDQNLQLHRRGHNLPWKLKQRATAEIRKRVYVCPEPSCVHHNPARALGDLTGIKKHFCRKHGEKKWKCDKCSKKYAVKSDWKAHSKTCGTKEYKCDCGTIFSRRDSFITHRAFCDALTEENIKASQGLVVANVGSTNLQGQVAAADRLIPAIPVNDNPNTSAVNISDPFGNDTKTMFSNVHGSLFGGAKAAGDWNSLASSCLQLNANPSTTMFDGNYGHGHLFSGSASMSATALLQKAAQMGATATASTFTTSTMAPPTFVSMQKSQQQQMQPEFFNASSAVNNNLGIFSGIFEQNNAFLKSVETPSSTGLSGFSSDTMTVDFLGIGGSRPMNLLEKQHHHHRQQQALDQFGGIGEARLQGLSHFQQHAALEKPMWKV
ncbi:hypothetical protein HRI_001602200 [Hibiscus trionum]|uniref:C2H2-type domain-containing protein n=1 Tax=Hibiscus trionum TaxID=183268 RepID=A0A9W7HL19_HIBTR|nr:hypothetical protein HRI_001602200 [Hibiscus trionum]